LNNPPIASYTYIKTDLTVDFTYTSTDPDGIIIFWIWDFGDGNASTTQNPSHIYATDGTYTVTLTVTDDDGATTMASQDITVNSSSSSELILSATGYKIKGVQHVDLTWSGSASTNVDVYRDGDYIETVPNSGFYTDNIGNKGGGSYTYQIYDTETWSNIATVTF